MEFNRITINHKHFEFHLDIEKYKILKMELERNVKQ